MTDLTDAARLLGQRGGSVKSDAKTAAAQRNATKPRPQYRVIVPTVPGSLWNVTEPMTLREARQIARDYRHRRDLTYQDVRIERLDGTLYEYAGPAR